MGSLSIEKLNIDFKRDFENDDMKRFQRGSQRNIFGTILKNSFLRNFNTRLIKND